MAAAKVWKTNCMNKEAAEREALLSSKLRHPNVALFIAYVVKENQPIIISELMSTDLRRYLDEKKKNAGDGPPLPLLVAMNILLQIAEAMNYLHENGVMHRDLKANNVLINVVEGPDGQLSSSSVQVKLTDFGESKLKLHDSQYTTPMVGTTRWRALELFEVEGPDGQLSSSSVQVELTDFGESKLKLHDSQYTTPMVGTTRWRALELFEVEGPDGQLSSSSVQVKLTDFGESKLKLYDSQYTTPMVGTTRWRAPEVFEAEENRKKYTKSADVYSFSMLCFEVLTGDVPFKDKPLGTLLESIRDGVRPQLPHVDYCPDYLSALIEKCCATNAVERPQFPIICQLLVDYKARVIDAFTEGLTSKTLSVLQQVQSLSVD
jgi:serine/threonine protein kinase